MKAIPLIILFLLALFYVLESHGQQILVKETMGTARIAEPVTLGIPFEEGVLNNTDHLGLSLDGTAINVQFTPMSTWNDGSIRWLKCDFQATVGANTTATYEITNSPTSTPTGLSYTEDGASITVNTGNIQFTVSKTNFNLFDAAWIDLNEDGTYSADENIIQAGASAGAIAEESGSYYSSSNGTPTAVVVEEAGPMKIVIRASGRHYNNSGGDFLKYETRITAYADQKYVRVWHTYANDNSVNSLGDAGNPSFGAEVDLYGLNVQLNLSGTKSLQLGTENGNQFEMNLTNGGTARLVQQDRPTVDMPFGYQIFESGELSATGGRSEGWLIMSDANYGLGVSSKYFWQKYPKGIVATDDGSLSLQAVPEGGTFLLAGMGSGDEYTFWLFSPDELSNAGAQLMARSKAPLLATCTPETYTTTNAFYQLNDCYQSRWPLYDVYINTTTVNHLSNRESIDLYGNLNFGDVPVDEFAVVPNRFESAWGNNYYDCALTAARLYALTNNEEYFDILEPMVFHWRETDCWNTNENDWLNGYNGAYSTMHRVQSNFGHHYGEGIFYYYYLTGDERALEIGLRAADAIVYQQFWGNENVGCRTAYQRGSVCLEAYKATGNEVYLNHCRQQIDAIMNTQNEYGMIGGSGYGGTVINGEQTFMMGLFSDLVWKYLQENWDQALANQLTAMADFVDQYARLEAGQENYYNFWYPPNEPGLPQPFITNTSDDFVYWNGKGLVTGLYAYAFDVSGDPAYLEMATNLLDHMWIDNVGSAFGQAMFAKSSSQAMKNTLHAASIVCASLPTDLEEPELTTETIKIAPNPVSKNELLNFELPESTMVMVYDLQGNLVLQFKLRQGTSNYHQDLAAGLYLFQFPELEGVNPAKVLIMN